MSEVAAQKVGRCLRLRCRVISIAISRMTWFKTDFLWMTYRCNWARSANQTTVLAIKVKIDEFWRLLANAVPSSAAQSHLPQKEYKAELAKSDCRLQWDPGEPCFSSVGLLAVALTSCIYLSFVQLIHQVVQR
jgi:hypothetical protein